MSLLGNALGHDVQIYRGSEGRQCGSSRGQGSVGCSHGLLSSFLCVIDGKTSLFKRIWDIQALIEVVELLNSVLHGLLLIDRGALGPICPRVLSLFHGQPVHWTLLVPEIHPGQLLCHIPIPPEGWDS